MHVDASPGSLTHDAPGLKQLVRVVRRRHGALEQQVAFVAHVTLIGQQRALPAARSLLALFEKNRRQQ